MPYSARVKSLAYRIDPACWISYSGKERSFKGLMDSRRTASLNKAERLVKNYDKTSFRVHRRPEAPMPPMKMAMMLHFATVAGPFATRVQRNSPSYVKFVRELLADDMVVRPSTEDRIRYPGWAYTATDKGKVYVEALKRVPLPVKVRPEWVMPEPCA